MEQSKHIREAWKQTTSMMKLSESKQQLVAEWQSTKAQLLLKRVFSPLALFKN